MQSPGRRRLVGRHRVDITDPGKAGAPPVAPGAPTAAAGPINERRSPYPPIAHFLRDPSIGEGDAVRSSRLLLRARRDPQLMLAAAVTLPIGVLMLAGLTPGASLAGAAVLAPAIFLGAQVWMTSLRSAPAWLQTARLWFSLCFVLIANLWADPDGT